jgi:hypothetical protein
MFVWNTGTSKWDLLASNPAFQTKERDWMTLALRRFLVQPVAAVVVDGVDVAEDIGAPQQVWTVEQFAELVDKCQAEIEQHNAAEETET